MFDVANNQEFMKIMQKEVDVIHTDNTINDNIQEGQLNLETSNRHHKKEIQILRKPKEHEVEINPIFMLNENFSKKSQNPEIEMIYSKIKSMTNLMHGIEKRLLFLETNSTQKQVVEEISKRIEGIEKGLKEIKEKDFKKKSNILCSKEISKIQRVGSEECLIPSKNEVLSEVIKNIKSKLQHRNSLLQNIPKTQKV